MGGLVGVFLHVCGVRVVWDAYAHELIHLHAHRKAEGIFEDFFCKILQWVFSVSSSFFSRLHLFFSGKSPFWEATRRIVKCIIPRPPPPGPSPTGVGSTPPCRTRATPACTTAPSPCGRAGTAGWRRPRRSPPAGRTSCTVQAGWPPVGRGVDALFCSHTGGTAYFPASQLDPGGGGLKQRTANWAKVK